MDHRSPADLRTEVRESLRFTGSGSEYFRIWIVNVFLTILTAGIYAAWAKVRTRRYFYRCTTLQSTGFEYLANPLAILKGNLIVFGAAALYGLSKQFNPFIAAVAGFIGYALLPYLIWKSLRFRASSSSFRNLRFRFGGTLGEAYKEYLGVPLLIPLTLGAVYPYWEFRKKKFFVDNWAYGRTYAYFDGKPGFYYRTYLKGFLLWILPAATLGALTGVAAALLSRAGAAPAPVATRPWLALLPALFALPMLLLVLVLRAYIAVRTTNYLWTSTRVGPVRFECDLRFGRMLWLTVGNVIAIIGTLGLLFPWAKVRVTRYVLERLTVVTQEGIDGFAAGAAADESAVGDAALGFLDLEIGL